MHSDSDWSAGDDGRMAYAREETGERVITTRGGSGMFVVAIVRVSRLPKKHLPPPAQGEELALFVGRRSGTSGGAESDSGTGVARVLAEERAARRISARIVCREVRLGSYHGCGSVPKRWLARERAGAIKRLRIALSEDERMMVNNSERERAEKAVAAGGAQGRVWTPRS